MTSQAMPAFPVAILLLTGRWLSLLPLSAEMQVTYDGTTELKASSLAADRQGNLFACAEGSAPGSTPGSTRVTAFSGGVAIAYSEAEGAAYVAYSSGVVKKYDGRGKLLANSPSDSKFGAWFSDSLEAPCRGLKVHGGSLYLSCYYEGKVKKAKLDLTDRGPKSDREQLFQEASSLSERGAEAPAGATEAKEVGLADDPAEATLKKDAGGAADAGAAAEPGGQLLDVLTGLFRPCGIAFDVKGGFYVALEGSHRVRKYDTTTTPWKLLWEVGSVATRGKKQFRGPHGLCVEGDHLYVADVHNFRANVYTLSGNWVGTFGAHGNGDYQFRFPADLAAWTGSGTTHFVVADTGNQRLQRYRVTFGKETKGGGQ